MQDALNFGMDTSNFYCYEKNTDAPKGSKEWWKAQHQMRFEKGKLVMLEPVDKMLGFLAQTPARWKDYWFKSLQVKPSELSSVVPVKKDYNVSKKEQRRII